MTRHALSREYRLLAVLSPGIWHTPCEARRAADGYAAPAQFRSEARDAAFNAIRLGQPVQRHVH